MDHSDRFFLGVGLIICRSFTLRMLSYQDSVRCRWASISGLEENFVVWFRLIHLPAHRKSYTLNAPIFYLYSDADSYSPGFLKKK